VSTASLQQDGATQSREPDAFGASLERAGEDMRRLADLMLEELRAIESRDPDGLQRVVRDKQLIVARLEAETARQRQWVESAGFSFTPEGVERFIRTQTQAERLGAGWSTLLAHTRRCSQLNSDNARSIERDQRRIAMTLRLLKGEDAGATYDPRGRTAAGGHRGRSLSQA